MLESMGDYLWTVEGGTLYRTSIRSMTWQQVGKKGGWENTVVMVADQNYLWDIGKDGTLYRTKG